MWFVPLPLRHRTRCNRLRSMATLTIRLDDKLDAELRDLVARMGKSKGDFAREALRRQIALARFEELRRRVAPFAEARGWLTDEDVFEEVS